MVRALALDARTVRRWQQAAGSHAERVQQTLVETPRAHGQIQVDERRITTQGGLVWVASAIAVASRWWLGAVVQRARDQALAVRILQVVRRCVPPETFWLCGDGWRPYVSAAHAVFRQSVPRQGQRGRCHLHPWPGLVLVPVVKHAAQHHLVGIVRRVAIGEWPLVHRWFRQTQGHGVFSTAWIERRNATFRARWHAWVRRGRAQLRSPQTMPAVTYLVGTIDNFCTPHRTLSGTMPTTPAMAAALTREVWSIERLLTTHPTITPWEPPRHRGRRSQATIQIVARGCPHRWASSQQTQLKLHGYGPSYPQMGRRNEKWSKLYSNKIAFVGRYPYLCIFVPWILSKWCIR